MAGNARFHDKLHRKNHHTLPTVGYPDSGTDPIASYDEPFIGDFVIKGSLSTTAGLNFLSASIDGDFSCENLYVRNYTITNFISGESTETIISDGALTGYGEKTLTMDFTNGIYAKSPSFNITNQLNVSGALYGVDAQFTELSAKTLTLSQNAYINGDLLIKGNLSAIGEININPLFNTISATDATFNTLSLNTLNLGSDASITGNTSITGNLVVYGDLSAFGTSLLNTNFLVTSALTINNDSTNPSIVVNQLTTGCTIATFESDGNLILNLSDSSIYFGTSAEFNNIATFNSDVNVNGSTTFTGTITATQDFNSSANIYSTNINTISTNLDVLTNLVSANSSGWAGSGGFTQTIAGDVTFTDNILFDGTSAHYIKAPYGSDDALVIFGGTTTGVDSTSIHPFYSLSGWSGEAITADGSLDTILPYSEKKIVYGSENVTSHFLVRGTKESPLAVENDDYIASIRGFAYSGNNKFNTYGGGGNASIDIMASGAQTLSNGGGFIRFTTMPMNSGVTIAAQERMRITSEGKVGIGTGDPTGLSSPLSDEGRSLHLYNDTNDGTSTNSNTVVVAESVNRNAYFLASVGNVGGLSLKRSSDATHLGRIIMNQSNDTIFQAGDGGYGLIETMRILSSGQVGIGTASPITTLDVSGNTRIVANDFTDDVGSLTIIKPSSAFNTNDIVIYTYGSWSEENPNNTAGGLKIKTAGGAYEEPTATLSGRLGYVIGSSTHDGVTWKNSSAINLGLEVNCDIDHHKSYISFETLSGGYIDSTCERMRIDSQGNIGIGTIPTNSIWASGDGYRKIEMTGNGGSVIQLNSNKDVTDGNILGAVSFANYGDGVLDVESTAIVAVQDGVSEISPGGRLAFYTRENDSIMGERMRITGQGNIGIGTVSPLGSLHVSCSTLAPAIRITQSGETGAALYVEDESGIDASPTVIDYQGHMGIGTAEPNESLTVVGNISATGVIYGTPATSFKTFVQKISADTLTIPELTNEYIITTGDTYTLLLDTVTNLTFDVPINSAIKFTVLNMATGTITVSSTNEITNILGTTTVSTSATKNFLLRKTSEITFDMFSGI